MIDPTWMSLACLPRATDVQGALDLAVALTQAVADLHAQGIVHLALDPDHVRVRSDAERLAITLPAGNGTTVGSDNNPFRSPEQTGRVTRPVDHRSDLYALGALLYQSLTGRPPFPDTDPLGLLHAQLTRTPRPVGSPSSWVPADLSEIVLTLLAKEPDDRYQRAEGVLHDLHLVRQRLRAREVTPLVLRTHDLPLSPPTPRRLHGRDLERARLIDAFEGITHGGVALVLVTGPAGAGKTILARELIRPAALAGGWGITARFEPGHHDQPLHAFEQALSQLLHLLLTETDQLIAIHRARILTALGPDAAALATIVPDLVRLTGPLGPAPQSPPLERQQRVLDLVRALLRAVASPERPLVLLLDDLHWADQPSLDLLDSLIDDPSADGILIIGSYQDQLVSRRHPLRRLLDGRRTSGAPPPTLVLDGLGRDHLAELLTEMLLTPVDELGELPDLVLERTGGNPSYTVELVKGLATDGLIIADPGAGRWRWDEDAIRAQPLCESVGDYLTQRLGSDLGSFCCDAGEPQCAIDAASGEDCPVLVGACLGSAMSLGALAVASGINISTLPGRLLPALEQRVLVTDDAISVRSARTDARVRFVHDHMHDAVHGLPDDGTRAALHLRIARRLVASLGATVTRIGSLPADPTDPQSAIAINAAEHYLAAGHDGLGAAERTVAHRLTALAGERAAAAGWLDVAERFCRYSNELLPHDAWTTDPAHTFDRVSALHRVLCSRGHHDEADEWFAALERAAPSPERLVDPARLQIRGLVARRRPEEACELGLELLDRLGFTCHADGAAVAARAELANLRLAVEDGALERLTTVPADSDPSRAAAARLASQLVGDLESDEPMVTAWLALRCAREWIEHGFDPQLLHPTSCAAFATVMLEDDPKLGHRIAQAALDAVSGCDLPPPLERARARLGLATSGLHWFEPLERSIEQAKAAYTVLSADGDPDLASASLLISLTAVLSTAERLADIETESLIAAEHAAQSGDDCLLQVSARVRRFCDHLTGEVVADDSRRIVPTDTQTCIDPAGRGLERLLLALAAAIDHDQDALDRHLASAEIAIVRSTARSTSILVRFLDALGHIGALRRGSGDDAIRRRAELDQIATWLSDRARDAPWNVEHLALLVEAEICDLEGRRAEALERFDAAMRGARLVRRPWQLALISERAARSHLRNGHDEIGRALLAAALRQWQQWGAHRRVNDLVDEHPALGRERGTLYPHEQDLDRSTLVRAASLLAAESTRSGLVEQVVTLMGQLGGATDLLFLVLDEDARWHLEGGHLDGTPVLPTPLEEAAVTGLVPMRMFRLITRTEQVVVSDDAVADPRLSDDPHLDGLDRCSMIGLPVNVQGTVRAVLVLEHRGSRGAFDAERVDGLSLLGTQLAISLQNIRVHETLEQTVADRTRMLAQANARLESLSQTDGLTGVANRRRFDEVLATEWARSRRSGRPIGLALLDVDAFKAFNDHYGHQAGDDALRAVGRALIRNCRRAGDLAARYGGEEFAILVPDAGLTGMAALAEAIRSTVADLRLNHIGGIDGIVTVSIGIAVAVADPASDPSDLVAAADRALYRAKRSGRNRVEAELLDDV